MAAETTGSTVPRRQLGRYLRELRNRERLSSSFVTQQPKHFKQPRGAEKGAKGAHSSVSQRTILRVTNSGASR